MFKDLQVLEKSVMFLNVDDPKVFLKVENLFKVNIFLVDYHFEQYSHKW